MSFIRPEATQSLVRWRETLIGVVVFALGLWWALGVGGLLSWIGGVLIVAGTALTFVGVQRARFRSGTGGPGIVQIDEGRVAYFGPLTGGVVDLAEVTRLALDPTGAPPHWVLSQPGQPDLFIPTTAEGHDALFDAFASLPGLPPQKILSALSSQSVEPTTIWTATQTRLH